MQRFLPFPLGTLGFLSLMVAPLTQVPAGAQGQDAPSYIADMAKQLKAMRQELDEQREKVKRLEQALLVSKKGGVDSASDEALDRIRIQSAPVLSERAAPASLLGSQRGMGTAPDQVQNNPQENPERQAQTGAVGKAPRKDSRPPEVAPLFEQPGVLTMRGKFVLEPSLQFGYASNNRVALVGYTIIPALLIGLIDVREVKRNTLTGSLALRYGLTNRLEVEARVPYVYRSDATVSRELFTGTAVDRVFDTSGKGVGDVELAARYQLNDGGADKAYYIGGLRLKSRTGRDPFQVVTDCSTRCVGTNVTGTGLPLNLPTGSGFYSLQPTLTFLFPSDPAIFFGTVSYIHNFKRSNVERTVLDGTMEPLGTLQPGGVIGFNFGMGLALNEKASLSLGYDHSSVARMRQNGITAPGSVRTQLGTLLVAYSYRFSERRSLSVSVGVGVTRDTPDVSLTVRVPTTF